MGIRIYVHIKIKISVLYLCHRLPRIGQKSARRISKSYYTHIQTCLKQLEMCEIERPHAVKVKPAFEFHKVNDLQRCGASGAHPPNKDLSRDASASIKVEKRIPNFNFAQSLQPELIRKQ